MKNRIYNKFPVNPLPYRSGSTPRRFVILVLIIYFLPLFIFPEAQTNVKPVLSRQIEPGNHAAVNTVEEIERQKLTQILKKTADYCKKLKEAAIYYYCREKVKETIFPLPKKYRGIMNRTIGIHGQYYKFQNKDAIINEYLYDYQLIRKSKKKVKEKRILLRENGKKKHKKKAILQTKCFRYSEIVYGPLVFEESEQHLYSFKIARKEKWGQGNALVIRVLPQPGVQKKLLWGEFWVDDKNFTILKIKMSQESIGDYYKIEKTATLMNAEPRITIIMEYDIEKNGIRFPGKFSLKEGYVNAEDEKFLLSELLVQYNEYRFFNVGVDVEIKEGN